MAKMVKCRKCKGEIPKGASKCMHCGASQGTSAGTIVAAVIFFIVLFTVIRNCNGNPEVKPKPTGHEVPSNYTVDMDRIQTWRIDDFEVKIKNSRVVNGIAEVTGTVKNKTGKDLEYVNISIALFKWSETEFISSNTVGFAVAHLLNLKSGEKADFVATGKSGHNTITSMTSNIKYY